MMITKRGTMAQQEEAKKKPKRSTAKKREIQNVKRKMENRVLKSKVRTTIRYFEDALKKNDKSLINETLKAVYSMMDKGVKKGIFKLNKASRTKSRLTARAHAEAQ